MNHHQVNENMSINAFLQPIIENGQDGMLEAMRVLVNAAMLAERSQFIGAGHYERTEERTGQANGFKPKTLQTRLGSMHVDVPQTRDSKFYPTCLEKGMRSERAIYAALAEMYIQGVSTRKVTKILEKMCGVEVSSTQVSRATASLDDELSKWRERPIGDIRYLILDARYERVRVAGSVRDCAVLIAYGVTLEGKRTVLGTSIALSEAEVHWRAFFSSLVKRGLHGLDLITSDAHEGLKAARKAVFRGVKWQRCQFHLQQNVGSQSPNKEMQPELHNDIRNIFTAPNKEDAQSRLNQTIEKYSKTSPKLSEWIENNIEEGLTVFAVPEGHRIKLRTSNMAEVQNKELKKRTRVIRVFPNEESLLRIVTARLMEVDEGWLSDKNSYIVM